MKQWMGYDEIPADRLCFQTADMDFKCAPEITEALKKTAEHGIFGYSGIPDAYYDAIIEDPYLRAKYKVGFPFASPFGISAVIAAYTQGGEWVDELNEYIDKIIDYFMERLAKNLPKAHAMKPEGTYILWVDFSGYGLSDDELKTKIDAAHIIIGNGTGFDAINGGQMWRFCLTSPLSQVKEMFDRLAAQFKDC